MLGTRTKMILRKLMSVDTAITGKYLANINQVSARTIREDIKHLDSILEGNGAAIESVMGKGYKLNITDEDRFWTYIRGIANDLIEEVSVPNVPEERVAYIIKRLLLSEGYMRLDDLAMELFVSKSTVQNDLKNVKELLSGYEIRLESRPNYGLKISGKELKIRFCMSEYVFDYNEEVGYRLLRKSLETLSQEDLDVIQSIIMDEIKNHQITISDIAVNNLLIHLAVAVIRIRSGNYVKLSKNDLEDILDKKEYEVAEDIARANEQRFQIEFPKEEIAYIAIHLLGIKMIAHSKENVSSPRVFFDIELVRLVEYVLNKVELRLNLGINDDEELKNALFLHLKPAINRYKYGMMIRNPMLEDIKKNYPLYYEAAVIAGVAIEEVTGTKIDENEAGYIALHIGAAIERKKLKEGPKRCLIVCASGLGTAKLIFYKLKNYFGQTLDVVGTTEYYKLKQYDLEDIDFIISSIPIIEEIKVPVIKVQAVLGDEDIRKIQKYMANHNQQKDTYFQKELIFLKRNFNSKDEVLSFLHGKLLEKGLVDETFLEAVYERENVASTAYGNLVAIPHPITPQSEETFLTVCTLEKPITWDHKPVQLICLLCVKKKSTEDLQSLYDFLVQIIDNSAIVEKLVKVRKIEDFFKTLKK